MGSVPPTITPYFTIVDITSLVNIYIEKAVGLEMKFSPVSKLQCYPILDACNT